MPKTLSFIVFFLWAVILFFALGLAHWQYQGDAVLLNYASWLWVAHGQVPYRDLFETSMPGTFFVHALIMGFGLEGNIAFLGLGFGLLVALGALGARILKQTGLGGGLFFFVAYVTLMLLFGPNSMVQRELIATAFIGAAFLLGFRGSGMVWVGFLYGLAALIKPQLALTAPIVVLAASFMHQRALLRSIVLSIAGFAAPLAATGLWLWSVGALDKFLFLLTKYLPLHIQQSTYHVFLAPDDRLQYLAREAVSFGGFWALVAGPLVLTFLQFLARAELTREQHITLGALTVVSANYSLIPILAGQFWDYHYFPFLFFASLSTAACITFTHMQLVARLRIVAWSSALLVPLVQAALIFDPKMVEKNQRDTQMVRNMEAALTRWRPRDGRVQPVDWTRGGIHAMLHSRAPIATPFLYDYHFRHHISGSVTRKLREEFMGALQKDPPELFLEVPTRPRMKGLDISYDWPEFDRFLIDNYRIVERAPDHIIHLRNEL